MRLSVANYGVSVIVYYAITIADTIYFATATGRDGTKTKYVSVK